MIHQSNFIINKNQNKIFTQSWRPDNKIEAAILLIHGYAGHSGRYEYFAHKMTQYNVAVYALDLQGFGRSDGLKADIEYFNDYVDDTSRFLGQLTKELPNVPIYLMGHCMGGNVAVLTAADHQDDISGLILTAPALKVVSNLPKVVQDMANYVSAFAATVPVMPLDVSALSKDSKVIEEFKNDTLSYHGRIRARMAIQMKKGAEKARELAGKITIPVWLGQGTEDEWMDAKSTESFVTNVSSNETTFRLYNGLYHDILHEPEKDEVIVDIGKWINNLNKSISVQVSVADDMEKVTR